MRFNKIFMICTLAGATLVPAAAYSRDLGAGASVGVGAGIGGSGATTGANVGGSIGGNTGLTGGASASAPGASTSNSASGGLGVGTWRDHNRAGAGAGLETGEDLRADTPGRPARAETSGAARARGATTVRRPASTVFHSEGGASGAIAR